MSGEENQRPVRILLIEDDEDDCVLVREALRGSCPEQVELDWRDDTGTALEALCGAP
jgi:hypothetical protein